MYSLSVPQSPRWNAAGYFPQLRKPKHWLPTTLIVIGLAWIPVGNLVFPFWVTGAIWMSFMSLGLFSAWLLGALDLTFAVFAALSICEGLAEGLRWMGWTVLPATLNALGDAAGLCAVVLIVVDLWQRRPKKTEVCG